MRTSLNDIKITEAFLNKQLPPEEALIVEARMLVQPSFKQNVSLQRKLYALIRYYGRQLLKKEITGVHDRLFTESGYAAFQKEIHHIFKK